MPRPYKKCSAAEAKRRLILARLLGLQYRDWKTKYPSRYLVELVGGPYDGNTISIAFDRDDYTVTRNRSEAHMYVFTEVGTFTWTGMVKSTNTP